MGGILADGKTASPLPGLYSVGECSSVGIHGANRLGSNSLTELLVFGKVAGDRGGATSRADGAARQCRDARQRKPMRRAQRALAIVTPEDGSERIAALRREMAQSMEERLRHLPHGSRHAGHLRQARRAEAALPAACSSTTTRRSGTPNGCSRSSSGISSTWRRRWCTRRCSASESRGSHQRLDGFEQRDDVNFLKHTLAHYARRRRAAHRLRAGEDHAVASPARAPTAPPANRPKRSASRGGARCLKPRSPSRSRCCATAPSRTTAPVVQTLSGAVHRRHVGAAGPAVHQGRARRHAELPLVVPHGDLRQLRHDDRRQARARRARPSCATCCPGRCASRRSRIFRSSATWWSTSTTSSASSRASSPTSIPKEPRTLGEGEYLQTPAATRAVSSSSARASTACCATPPARSTGSIPTSPAPGVLALLHRYNADSRDGGRAQRMELVNAEEGVWSCTAVGYCSEVCPKQVDPANAVNQNKVEQREGLFPALPAAQGSR